MFQFLKYLLLTISISCYALPQDSTKPMEISANSTSFNYKSGTDIYENNVVINQGSTHFIADKLITQKNDHHKLEIAIAYGINGLAEYITQPKQGDTILHAKAKIIRFYPLKSLVVLENNVLVTQGENSFHGEMIIYNIKDQLVTAPATKNGRTTIIIEPKQLTS